MKIHGNLRHTVLLWVLVFSLIHLQVHVAGAINCAANGNTITHVTATPNRVIWLETPTVASGTYPNMTCSWNVSGPPAHILFIGIDYQNQAASWTVLNSSCGREYVHVYDGASSLAALLGEACADKVHTGAMFSSGSNVLVEVKTAGIANKTRVRLAVNAMMPTSCQKNVTSNRSVSTSATINITSPYYPYSYPGNTTCIWRIYAPPGHVIKLALLASMDCYDGDFLEIFDGGAATPDNIMTRLCAKRDVIYSTSENMVLQFVSGSESRYWQAFKGFQADFTAVIPGKSCSKSNTVDQNTIVVLGPAPGVLSSPNYPNTFPNDLDCHWRIRGPPGHIVKLTFHAINIEGKNCDATPSLKILDGLLSDSATLWSVVCRHAQKGHYPTFSVFSSSRDIGVRFKSSSDYPGIGFGFKVSYTFQPLDASGSCASGTINLHGQGASFHSANYYPYGRFLRTGPTNIPCAWNISVDPGYRIQFTILGKYLASNCANENVTFYDGPNKASPLISTACQFFYSNTPRYTTGSHLLVEYNTKSSQIYGRGFAVMFKVARAMPKSYACSGYNAVRSIAMAAAEKREYLASYGFPQSYPYFAHCKWTIMAPFGKVPRLTLTSFHLEKSTNCTRDYVRVLGRRYASSKEQLALLCGSIEVPHVIRSQGREMEVLFVSDVLGMRYPGFEAYVEAINDPAFGNCTLQGQDNIIPLTGRNGIFFSPRHPHTYPQNMICIWVITVPRGGRVKVRLKPFSLDYNCKSYVEVRDGETNDSRLLGTYCKWDEQPSIFSSGSQLWVKFASPKSITSGRGFYGTYEAVYAVPLTISCRRPALKTMTSPGAIASYNYPLKYDNDVMCQWVINVPFGQRVKLTFESFNLQDSLECSRDYVEVRNNYGSSDSGRLGRYCGGTRPEPVHSTDNRMVIKFVADGSGRYGGFKASFRSELSTKSIVPIAVFSVLALAGLCVLAWTYRSKLVTLCAKCRATSASGRAIPEVCPEAGVALQHQEAGPRTNTMEPGSDTSLTTQM